MNKTICYHSRNGFFFSIETCPGSSFVTIQNNTGLILIQRKGFKVEKNMAVKGFFGHFTS